MDCYEQFLESKALRATATGIARPVSVSPRLFPFQASVCEFALTQGRAGIFLGTGLGKSLIQLEWAKHAASATNGRSLILAPLAVAHQFKREGDLHGYDVTVIKEPGDARDGVNVCNYDRLDKIDADDYGAVSLDESSILKSFGGKTQQAITKAFSGHRFRLAASATPAPNDHMELGTQAEFLGVITMREMLSRWFINDTSTASQKWRLKGHASNDFWSWVSSWARVATTPSDIGFDDDGYILPPIKIIRHRVHAHVRARPGELFATEASATTLYDVKRQTSMVRAEAIARCVLDESSSEPWVIWCDTNDEADAVTRLLPDAVEVRGSMAVSEKEAKIAAFLDGSARILVSKPSICGFGLNFQHCARTAFVGRTFSFESWYQAVRRFHRFGQKRQVHVHIAVSDGESQTDATISRKEQEHERMRLAVRSLMLAESKHDRMKSYNHGSFVVPEWVKNNVEA